MKKKPASKMLNAVRFYTYFFSFFMAIGLFVLPMAISRPKFMDSDLIDVLFRCALWLWLVFAYWSLVTALTSQISGSGRYFLEMERNASSFVLLMVNAIVFGVGISFLTYWGLVVFSPGLVKVAVSLIASSNGLIYAALLFARYFWLTESK